MNNYQEVPSMISSKDLSYLSDMFEWNYGAYKSCYNSIDKVSDNEIKGKLQEGAQLFDESMQQVIEILGGRHE